MNRFKKKLSNNRGMTLAVMLIIFPIVIALYLVVFTRLDAMLRETQRHESRTQARLLAETALAQWKDQMSESKSIQETSIAGSIEKVGIYRVRTEKSDSGDGKMSLRVVAIGEVVSPAARTTCEIAAFIQSSATDSGGWTLLPSGTTYRIEALSP